MASLPRIDEFEPASADEAAFRSRWELTVALDQESDPETPPTPFDKHRKELVDPPSFRRPKHWTAWDDEDGRPLGYAILELEYTETNRHLAWSYIGVRPDVRRRGIGTALLGRIIDAATADGRTMLGTWTVDGSAGDAFSSSVGFECKATERKSRLTVADIDRSMLEAWTARAAERAGEYELLGFDDRCPDDLVEPYVALYDVTNTAPRDDLDMEDVVLTPERFRERETKAIERGDSCWILVARHRATGELAGFTQFFFAPHAPELAWQGWTAVHPDHRDRGLGRWLKAANCIRLLDERPSVAFVDTDNAFSNAPMLAINIEMGFQLLRGYNDWQAPTERLDAAVKERISR